MKNKYTYNVVIISPSWKHNRSLKVAVQGLVFIAHPYTCISCSHLSTLAEVCKVFPRSFQSNI
jgi:hypothetical protein